MYSKEFLEKNKALQKEWEKGAAEMAKGELPVKLNDSGIEIKSLYTPEDIKHLDHNDISVPGEFPFTRGIHHLLYQVNPLIMSQGFGFGTADESRERRQFLKDMGARFQVGGPEDEDSAVYVLTCDLPTQRGYDPDEAQSRGKVGGGGVSIATVDDFEGLFKGVDDIEKVLTLVISFDGVLTTTALWAAYMMDRRKEPVSKGFALGCNVFNHQWWSDSGAFPIEPAMKLSVEYMKWCVENTPLSYPMMFDSFNPHSAGAHAVHETTFDMSHIIAIIEESVKVGLDPDDVAPRCWGHIGFSLNFFEDIAKLRAMRRMWAEVMKERFGCKKKESLKLNTLMAQTHGTELTAQELPVNIVRTTAMAISAMLAGVDGLWIACYDEAVGIPTEEAAKVALRTYQVLGMETDIPDVTDPLGGSYYIESLTDKIYQESKALMKKMDDLGGYYKCWESGFIKGEMQKNANKRFMQLQNCEKVKVGTTIYQVEDIPEYEPFRVPEGVEEKAVERIKKYRERRDPAKAGTALAGVRRACERMDREWPDSCGCLMEALIEGARSGLTLGEMNGIMREVFGCGYYADAR